MTDEQPRKTIQDSVDELRTRALELGRSEEEVDALVNERLTAGARAYAPALVEGLMKIKPKMLREHHKYNRGFERRLRRQWGPALDQMLMIVLGMADMSTQFMKERHADEPLFVAFDGLLSRAMRIGLEIHGLLTLGFPLAGLARTRTLHEIAAVAEFLTRFDGKEGSEDLAERYILHSLVQRHKDAQFYQRDHVALGVEPMSDKDLADIKADHDELIERFGENFGEQSGWAWPIVKNPRGGPGDFDKLVDMTHQKTPYRLASHEVHADSRSSDQSVIERGGEKFYLSGKTNVDLFEPAYLTVMSLFAILESIMLSRFGTADDMAHKFLFEPLIDIMVEEFDAAEKRVEAAEEKVQRRLARKRKN